MQTIYLDISNKGVIPTIHAKQGDVGRKFQVVLTDSGLPYIPVGGSAFSVWYSGASGEGNYTEVGDKSAFSVSGNKVTVEMIYQMLSNDGDGILSLVLNDPNGNQISTWNIHYICECVPGAGSQEAKAYYTAFSQAVENLPYPDASLSASGKAADAAATGMALAGKAPAGYGLGETGWKSVGITDVAQLDDLKTNGGYYVHRTSESPLTLAGIKFNALGMQVNMMSSSYGEQVVNHTNGIRLRRHFDMGEWQPWEYENPPMELGVEYRTTERCNGKAVYTKCVSFGYMPGDGEASVEHGLATTAVWVDKVLADYYSGQVEVTIGAFGVTSIQITRTVMFISANGNFSTVPVYFYLKYTKD